MIDAIERFAVVAVIFAVHGVQAVFAGRVDPAAIVLRSERVRIEPRIRGRGHGPRVGGVGCGCGYGCGTVTAAACADQQY